MNPLSEYFKLKETSTGKISKRLVYIAVLNILDGIFTYVGVSNNYIVEANRIMTPVVTSLSRMILIKVLLPTLILLLIAYIVKKIENQKLIYAQIFINICLGVYVFVLFMHLYWIAALAYSSFH